MKRSNPQCKIGAKKVPPAKLKAAIEDWKAKRRKRKTRAAATSQVGNLPAPPTGVLAQWCMYQWYAAYGTASRLDALAAQYEAGLTQLASQVQAYNVCVAQHTV